MKTVTKTATEARKEFFDLLAAAKYSNQTTEITKNGKVTARLVPPDVNAQNWDNFKKHMKAAVGMFDDEDVKQINQVRIDSYKNNHPEW